MDCHRHSKQERKGEIGIKMQDIPEMSYVVVQIRSPISATHRLISPWNPGICIKFTFKGVTLVWVSDMQ